MGDPCTANHYGIDRAESSEERARRLVRRELKRLGWGEDELTRPRKGDRRKMELAGPVAGGNDDESGMDRGAIADGQLELRVEPVAKDQKCKK
jgi:hypothetical protein